MQKIKKSCLANISQCISQNLKVHKKILICTYQDYQSYLIKKNTWLFLTCNPNVTGCSSQFWQKGLQIIISITFNNYFPLFDRICGQE